MSHIADPVVRSLNHEWAELARAPVPHSWAWSAEVLGDALAAISDDPDARLGELLRRCAGGDQLAGRVVLQAMLGKLVRLAAEDVWHGVDEYVAECWLGVATYPLARRPRRIAANLAMDTRRRVRAGDDRRPAVAPATSGDGIVATALDVPGVVRAATSLGLIDRAAGACLYAVYGLGLRSHEAARELRISADLVRWRNARSIRRLAPHAAILAAVVA